MLLPTATTWEKRFPDSYYKALAKITGTKFNNHIGGSPAIFGDITNKWVYRIIMPKEVIEELRANKRDGQGGRFYDSLTLADIKAILRCTVVT
ncbi:P63C domain-containing protein [Acinetobacter guillouiae]|uniref:P63C domain-containing protein n=1 Tax=Acinetobacter guillouiae TaxID=106649 RepID=UPI0021CEB568|nr:P63C domain-containing protein [Acinetobacter guillouiae]